MRKWISKSITNLSESIKKKFETELIEQKRLLRMPQVGPSSTVKNIMVSRIFVKEGDKKKKEAFLYEVQIPRELWFGTKKRIVYAKTPCQINSVFIREGSSFPVGFVAMELTVTIPKPKDETQNNGYAGGAIPGEYEETCYSQSESLFSGDSEGIDGDGDGGDGGDGGD